MADFTIRFKSNYATGNSQLVIGCDKYTLYTHPSGVVEVVTYPTLASEGGVTYYVGSEEAVEEHKQHYRHGIEYYNIAFVSNSASKTIDKIC